MILPSVKMPIDFESELVNSDNDKIGVKVINRGAYAGQRVLCMVDDTNITPAVAMHLLDDETIDWLLDKLKTIKGIDK